MNCYITSRVLRPVTLSSTVCTPLTGTPTPTITWFIGKREIKESKFFKTSYDADGGGAARLEISGVYPEDQGEYYCVAENDAGRVTSKCDVTVIGKSRDVSACDIGDLSSQHNTPDITVLIDLSRPYV